MRYEYCPLKAPPLLKYNLISQLAYNGVCVVEGGGSLHYFLYLCDPIGCECDQRETGSSLCRGEKMVESLISEPAL